MSEKSKRGGANRNQGRKPIIGQCPDCLMEGVLKDTNLWKGLCKRHYNKRALQKRRYQKTGRRSPEEVRNKVFNGESIVEQVWKYFISKLSKKWKYDSIDSENQYWPSIEEIITRSKGDITLPVFKEYIDWLFSADCFITKGVNVKPGHLYNGPMWGAFFEKKDKKQEKRKTSEQDVKEEEKQDEEAGIRKFTLEDVNKLIKDSGV